jgi:murein L,D-transpeptidase YafK
MNPQTKLDGRELRIVIEKAARTLHLYVGSRLAFSHRVALGRNSTADKVMEGDEATPLGEF